MTKWGNSRVIANINGIQEIPRSSMSSGKRIFISCASSDLRCWPRSAKFWKQTQVQRLYEMYMEERYEHEIEIKPCE